jgi:thioredoxin-related protein
MLKKLLAALGALTLAAAAQAAELGDDGLHKADWMHETFLDLREDLADATAQGKRLAVMIEQRGCIYCTKMHEEVYPVPEIDALLNEEFYVVQINMFGDLEVTDFDGETLPEKDMVRKWGAMYTPTIYFFPEEVAEEAPANRVAAAYVPGALSPGMFYNMLTYVRDGVYETENFQKYHAAIFNAGEGLYADRAE